ncbi:hypothetical protein BH10PSE12_BH10PSE12_34120 [soil metagenome]
MPTQASPAGDPDTAAIRSISRAISVLQAINRTGALSLTDIARQCGLPYPTANRIVQALVHEGLIERKGGRKLYSPTGLVQSLSVGYQGLDTLVAGARPLMEGLTRDILWPVSFVTRVGTTMVVRDSTHSLTSLTFNNYFPGFTLPILGCASGLVYLAFASDHDRALIIRGLKAAGDVDEQVLMMFESGYLTDKIRADGFAVLSRNWHTLNPGKTSSIALPLFRGDELVGALTLIYFATAMSVADAGRKLLPELLATVRKIELAWKR